MEIDTLDVIIPNDKIRNIENIIGLKINKKNKNYLSKYSDITNLISSINFPEKEKIEYQNNIISKIKNISLNKIEKPYNFKVNNRTQYFNTAKNDSISETMSAFYFCEPKNNLSDKEATAMKGIHLHTSYDIPIDTFRKKDDDDLSSNSNNNINSPIKLKKKRKMSGNFTKSSKSKKKKIINSKDEFPNNKNNDEKEYCIPECKLGRKNSNLLMICCDNCGNWYHTICVGVIGDSNTINNIDWFCPTCQKKENDKDIKMEVDSNNNNN